MNRFKSEFQFLKFLLSSNMSRSYRQLDSHLAEFHRRVGGQTVYKQTGRPAIPVKGYICEPIVFSEHCNSYRILPALALTGLHSVESPQVAEPELTAISRGSISKRHSKFISSSLAENVSTSTTRTRRLTFCMITKQSFVIWSRWKRLPDEGRKVCLPVLIARISGGNSNFNSSKLHLFACISTFPWKDETFSTDWLFSCHEAEPRNNLFDACWVLSVCLSVCPVFLMIGQSGQGHAPPNPIIVTPSIWATPISSFTFNHAPTF